MSINRRMFLAAAGALATVKAASPTLAQQLLSPAYFDEAEPFPVRYVRPDQIPPAYRRQLVPYPYRQDAGSIVVDTRARVLYLVREDGQALRYGIGVGRDGFAWSGVAVVGDKQKWPRWFPPAEMRARQPELPEVVEGGPDNPLGARALYLYANGRDTLYRLHGTNEPRSIGQAVSSGCIRLLNQDIMDLYRRVIIGTRVVVKGPGEMALTG